MRARLPSSLPGTLLLALGACGSGGSGPSSLPAGPALPVAPLGHQGRWLTDATGRVVLPHGVNVVNKTTPYTPAAEGFNDTDAAWLAANGFRVARVGVLASGLMPAPGAIDIGYLAQVAATVHDLAMHEIYSLIDFHQDGFSASVGSDGFPDWMTITGSAVNNHAAFPLYYLDDPAVQQAFQSLWDDVPGPDGKGLQDDYVAMFSAMATEFASEPYVLGYDLFNEPWPGNTWSDCLNDPGGCPSLDTGELGALYAKAVEAIRAAGDRHLVLGEPFVLFNYGVSATSVPIPGGDAEAGMSFHVYPLDPADAPNVLANAATWASMNDGALLNTEWGATVESGTLVEQATAIDEALVPWIFWSFCCEVVSSFDASPSGSNLVGSSVAALVHAYPLAVAGTPQKLTTDLTARTLSFTWSTARAGGGSFAADAATTFEVPPLAFPKGYSVTVTHGVVASKPCAPLLEVLASPGATSVTVALTPGGTCGT